MGDVFDFFTPKPGDPKPVLKPKPASKPVEVDPSRPMPAEFYSLQKRVWNEEVGHHLGKPRGLPHMSRNDRMWGRVYEPERNNYNTLLQLMRSAVRPLQVFPDLDPGLYALFYKGDHPLYQAVSSPEARIPLYVGLSQTVGRRLGAHYGTLSDAFDLDPADFLCRFIRVSGFSIKGAEDEAIKVHLRYPWWNHPKFQGFGNAGSPRVGKGASTWDHIHPGRPRANGYTRTPNAQQLLDVAIAHKERGFIEVFE